MNIMKLLVKCLYAAEIIILMTLAGCTISKTLKNHQTLVITPNWSNDQDIRGGTGNNGLHTLGLDNDYLPKKFAFHPEIAKSIRFQHPGIQSVYVLLTEVNCYLAIVPNRHNPKLIASQEILIHRTDQKAVTGLFEDPDLINRVDWVSQSGNLPARSLEAIGRDAAKYMPANIKRIYVSANANFVSCLRFYAKEEQVLGDISMYLKEFNMIVERVYPD
jgi:hypothetical protein